jgi:hypothetical protein
MNRDHRDLRTARSSALPFDEPLKATSTEGEGMKIGAIIPQGWQGEYDGWEPL